MPSSWDDQYVNYLADEPMYPSAPSYDEDIQGAEGDYLTQAKKGAGLGADISYALMNGLLDPRVFQPISSFEPVDARGHRTLQNWKQGTPYQQYVADRLEQHWSPSQIRAELESMQVDPTQWGGDPEVAQSILNELPRRYDKSFNDPNSPLVPTKDPDFGSVDRDVQNLSDMLMGDPQFDTTDENGNPVRVKSEDSPMTEKARALGYYNTPGQPYDPWDFAPAGVTPERDAGLEAEAHKAAINHGYQGGVVLPEAIKARDAQAERYKRFLAVHNKPAAVIPVTPASIAAAVQTDPARPKNAGDWGTVVPDATSYLPDDPEALFWQSEQGKKTPSVPTKWPNARPANTVRGKTPVGGPGILMSMIAEERKKAQQTQGKVVKANLSNAQARTAAMVAEAKSAEAKRQQRARQALVEHLARNNRTPFSAEANARSGGVYGGFV